jgi:hypothetical protein
MEGAPLDLMVASEEVGARRGVKVFSLSLPLGPHCRERRDDMLIQHTPA